MVSRPKSWLSGDRRIVALLITGWAAVAAVMVLHGPAGAVSMVPMVVTLHRGQ